MYEEKTPTVLMDAILNFGPFVNAFALNSFHRPRPLFAKPVSASFGCERLGPQWKLTPWALTGQVSHAMTSMGLVTLTNDMIHD